MKKTIILAAALSLFSLSAYAGSKSDAYSQSASGSMANVTITNNGATRVRTTGSVKTTGTAIAPSLASSGVSCSNSASIGAGWMGGAGAFGIPIKDQVCDARENAKIIGIIDGKDAAREIMCDLPKVRAAYLRMGRPCLADRQKAYNTASGQVRRVATIQRGSDGYVGKQRNCKYSSSKYCK